MSDESTQMNAYLLSKENTKASNEGLAEEEIIRSKEKGPREGAKPGQIVCPVNHVANVDELLETGQLQT